MPELLSTSDNAEFAQRLPAYLHFARDAASSVLYEKADVKKK